MTALTNAPALAITYLGFRRWRRRVLYVRRQPWALLAVLLGLGASATAQYVLIRGTAGAALPPMAVDLAALLFPFVPLIAGFAATFRSPLRLETPDVSWVLTAPGGRRILLARYLFGFPVLLLVLVGAGSLMSRTLTAEPLLPAWKPAVVVASVLLLLRLVALLCHLLALRARRLSRALVVAAAAVLLFAAFAGGSLAGIRGEPLIRNWLLTITEAAAVPASWVLVPAAAMAVLGCLALVAARGYAEPADDRARQNAELQASMRRDTTGLESGSQWFQSGLRSLSGPAGWTGEAALLFRGLAQQRRMLLNFGVEFVLELLATAVLLVLAADFAWIPLAFLLAVAATSSSFTGVALELDHHHVWAAPLRPVGIVLAASAVPAATLSLAAELLWLTLFVGGSLTTAVWITGVVVLPLLAAVIMLCGALGVAVSGRSVLRLPISLGFLVLGAAPLAALVVVPGWLGGMIAAVALAGFGTAATLAASRRIRPNGAA